MLPKRRTVVCLAGIVVAVNGFFPALWIWSASSRRNLAAATVLAGIRPATL